jgi:adenine-specific DNA-methyltransferase
MIKKQKLELTWIGKGEVTKLEPRILIEDAQLSYHASKRHTDTDLFDNKLIFGDNLLALKALEQDLAEQVKFIYIDPPYNTGAAFEHYDDALEHSTWLSLMRERLVLLRKLMRDDGFICCHIDDSEGQYLKVLMDEVFGRSNYLVTFYVRVRYADKTLKQDMSFHKEIEQIHVYRKSYGAKPNQIEEEHSFDKFCFQIDELAEGEKILLGGKEVTMFKAGEWKVKKIKGGVTGLKEIWATGGILDGNSTGRFFRDFLDGRSKIDGLGVLYKVSNIGDDGLGYRYITGPAKATATKGKYYQGVPLSKQDSTEMQSKPIPNFYDFAASFGNCRHEGGVDFRSGKKPEALLEHLIKTFSDKGDLVLDSFAGSGSTGATAHKMGRRWVMVELGEHCQTHVLPRLKKVIDGDDHSGVSNEFGWKGGGGFRYYKLAPSLLEKDKWGNWVINKDYDANQLAAAVCKHEGFTYCPSETEWWAHGFSTETDFIYVTTQTLTEEQLLALSEDVGSERTLLVCCSAFKASDAILNDKLSNLTLKKMPHALLSKCEWGKDDYSLNISQLPVVELNYVEQEVAPKKKTAKKEADLFGEE